MSETPLYTITWYTDVQGRKVSYQRVNEQYQVVNGKIQLSDIPDSYYRLNIAGYTETNINSTITSATSYKVNYDTCEVYFDSSKEGATITIASYYGKGRIKLYAHNVKLEDTSNLYDSDNLEDFASEISGRVGNIISGAGASNTEIVDARLSTIKGKTFSVLKSRLEESEQDVLSLKADVGQRGVNVKDVAYGAKANGSDDALAIQKAINAAAVTGGNVIFPSGNYVTGNFTAPNNVTLVFLNGAKLIINIGSTIMIDSPIDAGLYQIFSGSGTVGGSAKVPEVYPQWWGAKADGTNDDKSAILAAINYLISQPFGGTIHFPAGNYQISGAIVINTTKPLIIKGEGQASRIYGQPGYADRAFDITNCSMVMRDLMFPSPPTGQETAIRITGCNLSRFEGVVFENVTTGIEMVNSFSVEVTSCVFNVCYTYGILSNTACHNLVVEKSNFYTCGVLNSGQAIRIDTASDNLVFDDNSFEGCYLNIQLNNCTAVSITNNYMEYAKQDHIFFVGTCQDVIIEKNWISLGDITWTVRNVKGGTLNRNTFYNQSIAYGGANVTDFIIGYNYKTGTGTIALTQLNIVTLLNSWTQQANYGTLGYIKDQNGKVHIEGNIVNSVAAVPSIAFNLPAGYRPDKILTFGTSGSSGFSMVTIAPNGDVTVSQAPGSIKETGLTGISFFAMG